MGLSKIKAVRKPRKLNADAEEEIESAAIQYDAARSSETEAQEAKEEAKKSLADLINVYAIEDDKGHLLIETDEWKVGHQKRSGSPKFTDKAEDVLKELGLFKEATTRHLDAGKIAALHETKQISDKDLRRIVTKSEDSFSVFVESKVAPKKKKK